MIDKHEIGGHVDIGGIKYPIIKINKSEYNRLKTQFDGKTGIPQYCCQFGDCMRILPNPSDAVALIDL
jgi:hypothetical protein